MKYILIYILIFFSYFLFKKKCKCKKNTKNNNKIIDKELNNKDIHPNNNESFEIIENENMWTHVPYTELLEK